MEAGIFLGLFLGSILSSRLYVWLNTVAVLFISFIVILFSFLTILFGINESIEITEENLQKVL